jgi:hypothetical protein
MSGGLHSINNFQLQTFSNLSHPKLTPYIEYTVKYYITKTLPTYVLLRVLLRFFTEGGYEEPDI